MKQQKNILIVGATSTMIYSCIKLLSKIFSINFFLIGRDTKKLSILKSDIEIRAKNTKVNCVLLEDFLDSNQISLAIESIFKHQVIDMAIIAQGELNQKSPKSLESLKSNFSINALSPIIFCESISSFYELQKKGHLIVFGSVAGDRGRKSNYIYGSAKAAIEIYLQGLTHRLAKKSIFITLVKPGPTLTPMTESMIGKINLQNPDYVAKFIIQGILKKKKIVYAPPVWKYIMLIIKNLPQAVFNKLDI